MGSATRAKNHAWRIVQVRCFQELVPVSDRTQTGYPTSKTLTVRFDGIEAWEVPTGLRAMSTSNAGIGFEESVLIVYHWPRDKPTSDLPAEIVALCPVPPSLDLLPRATGFICRGRESMGLSSDPPPSVATAVAFF